MSQLQTVSSYGGAVVQLSQPSRSLQPRALSAMTAKATRIAMRQSQMRRLVIAAKYSMGAA